MHLLNLPKSLKGKLFFMHDLPTLTFLCLFSIGFLLGHHTMFVLLVDSILVLLIKQMNYSFFYSEFKNLWKTDLQKEAVYSSSAET